MFPGSVLDLCVPSEDSKVLDVLKPSVGFMFHWRLMTVLIYINTSQLQLFLQRCCFYLHFLQMFHVKSLTSGTSGAGTCSFNVTNLHWKDESVKTVFEKRRHEASGGSVVEHYSTCFSETVPTLTCNTGLLPVSTTSTTSRYITYLQKQRVNWIQMIFFVGRCSEDTSEPL